MAAAKPTPSSKVSLECPNCHHRLEHDRRRKDAYCTRCGNSWAWAKLKVART